jgi:MinD superfamily P-loop ATPase
VKEFVVISGKGGTGKTSLTASFAALAAPIVTADCDVDAADLHLVLTPTVRQQVPFLCGHEAVIRPADCIRCGACLAYCRFEAVRRSAGGAGEADFSIDPTACEGCGVCVAHCPVKAIDFTARVAGEWYVSETRFGPMVHARLTPGGENSGKLVSQVREMARTVAAERHLDQILIDGPPGIGCAVIASLAGAARVLVVTEPTLSGEHDLGRVLELTRHFGLSTLVCVNKWDLNPDMAARIEAGAVTAGANVAGRVSYDRGVTAAQMQGLAVVEADTGPLAADIRSVWQEFSQ